MNQKRVSLKSMKQGKCSAELHLFFFKDRAWVCMEVEAPVSH